MHMKQRPIFRAEALPVLQNRVFTTAGEALASTTGDVDLVQAMDTGLIFNAAFDPGRIEYDQHYQNEQACSPVFKHHLDAVTEVIHRYFHGRTLIEVGCGKGYFLDHLQARGYAVTGIDPAYEGSNPGVVKARFERGLGLSADAIVLRHVLEHVPDPMRFLSSIAEANGGKGKIYIEVPCFDWICRRRAWFDVFYEHVNYFRMTDFQRMFGTIAEIGHLFGGQYLYVVADLSTLRRPRYDQTCDLAFPDDFLGGIHRLASIARSNDRNAVWGAASKGVVFAVYMRRAGAKLGFVIDINPAKHGKYLAVSGLQVLPPNQAMGLLQPGDNVFVMNSNYLDEIVAQSGNQYHYCEADHE
jgi:SAM-dependent methyltransferase